MRLSFLSVAVWWLVFSIPLFRRVPEPPRAPGGGRASRRCACPAGFARLGETFRELRRYRQAFLMLLAFLVYNDGIGTIIRMARRTAAEIGVPQGGRRRRCCWCSSSASRSRSCSGCWPTGSAPSAAIFLGARRVRRDQRLGLLHETATQFFVLCLLVGMVKGGAQALSRSLFASMVPRHKSAEFFAFFGVFDKFAGILGPAVFAVVIEATGSSRNAILAVIVFFVVGGAAALARGRRARPARRARGRGPGADRRLKAAARPGRARRLR